MAHIVQACPYEEAPYASSRRAHALPPPMQALEAATWALIILHHHPPMQALEAAKSSYLKPFLELSKMIQMGHEEANNLTLPPPGHCHP